jgi:hypothetical protein
MSKDGISQNTPRLKACGLAIPWYLIFGIWSFMTCLCLAGKESHEKEIRVRFSGRN